MLMGNNFGIFTSSKLLQKTSTQESFLSGTSSVYAEHMYDQWRKDPQSVHASWRIYFQNLEGGAATPFELPPTTGQDPVTQQLLNMLKSSGGQSTGGVSNADMHYNVQQSQKLMLLIRSYMTHGHMKADLDPLKLYESYNKDYPEYADKFKLPQTGPIHLLDYKQYGFSEADLDKDFFVDIPELAGLLQRKKNWKLRELIDAYTKAYCGKIGVEYMHIASRTKCNWIRDKFEGLQYDTVPKETRILNYDRLVWANEFQNFLANKFNTTKRFGVEGCESFIAGLKVSFDSLVESGVSKVIIGMPHRGRMNVLGNVVRKPLEQIFNEFQGKHPSQLDSIVEDTSLSGDVKYHLGTTFTKAYPNGHRLTQTVLANPSHLETIDPVVLGRARAEQHLMGDVNGEKVVPFIIHGDAAFAG
jgi:2-oxoglutarate dehydrogenase E1 component